MFTALPTSSESSGASTRSTRERVLGRVEQRIQEFLAAERTRWSACNADSVELIDCVGRMIGSGGKRLRPAFCIAGYLAGGGDPQAQEIVDMAAALELLHSFALLHDDVMDDSALRRNAPTAHVLHTGLHERRGWRGEPRRYGESVAILAGNLALVYAERLLADCAPAARRIWGELCTELMIGQFLDVRAAARFEPDPNLATWIALVKSGRYTVQRPLAMGVELAGAEALLEPFEGYGLAVGEAFQLRDDLLDIFGDPALTGKPARADLAQHKMTLLMSFALDHEPSVRELIGECGERLADTDPQELHDVLAGSRVRARVEDIIAARLRTAKGAVSRVLDGEWAAEFRRMAEETVHRNS